jgi:hypothetical protein
VAYCTKSAPKMMEDVKKRKAAKKKKPFTGDPGRDECA